VVRTIQWVSGSCIWRGEVDKGAHHGVDRSENVERTVRVEESRMEMAK
jgi:hypothetical protein